MKHWDEGMLNSKGYVILENGAIVSRFRDVRCPDCLTSPARKWVALGHDGHVFIQTGHGLALACSLDGGYYQLPSERHSYSGHPQRPVQPLEV